MDGNDGIAASEAICVTGDVLIISVSGDGGVASSLLGALMAASIGFLLWNWPPAKIFMGDVGSAFLGFILIVIAIVAGRDGSIAVWSWLNLGGVFIIDASVTLLV